MRGPGIFPRAFSTGWRRFRCRSREGQVAVFSRGAGNVRDFALGRPPYISDKSAMQGSFRFFGLKLIWQPAQRTGPLKWTKARRMAANFAKLPELWRRD